MIRALALMLLLGAGLAAFCHDLHPVALATGPDILLVTIDTLRADHCSAYGYAIETTPFLSDLAHEGVLYEQAWAPSATTAPSHAALFASRWPRSMGVMKNGQPVPGGELMLAELMSKGGYATAAFVSSLPVSSQFGFGQGFDYFDDDFNAEGSSRDKRKAQGHGRKYTHRLDRRADATARHFENWLRQRDDPRPLFAWLHFVDPHYPYGSDRLLDLEWPDSVGVSIRAYDSEILRADRGLETVVNAFRRHSAPTVVSKPSLTLFADTRRRSPRAEKLRTGVRWCWLPPTTARGWAIMAGAFTASTCMKRPSGYPWCYGAARESTSATP